jgi:outer membrane protein, multidrug efflux system
MTPCYPVQPVRPGPTGGSPAPIPYTARTRRLSAAMSKFPLTSPSRTLAARQAALAVLAAFSVGVAGCASVTGSPPSGVTATAATGPWPASVASVLPGQWQAPLPHAGEVRQLADWWGRMGDPLLVELVTQAQTVSPGVSAARSRIEQARAAVVGADAARLPAVSGGASISRGRQQIDAPIGTLLQIGPQASWEWDLFGGNRAASEAANARSESAVASWHDARVSVAADTAATYLQLRACEAQRAQTALDTASREETSRLTGLSERAGFQAPSAAALARASAAQGRALLTAQAAACDLVVKSLVALTGQTESALRSRLQASTARMPSPDTDAQALLAPVPGDVLLQRPDLRAALADWLAASADLRAADAARYPRVSLSGSLSAQRAVTGGMSVSGNVWSIGPLSLTLPIFDGGIRRSQSAAAMARLTEAEAQLRAGLRRAVREVEDALVQLASTAARAADARIAAEGFEASFKAAEARQRGGLASLFELEDARRTAVAANAALIDLQRERAAAWIALYRAAGGGWQANAESVAATPSNTSPTPR